MTPDEMDPLSPAAQALLALERQRPDSSGSHQERVLERLSATLGFAALAAGVGVAVSVQGTAAASHAGAQSASSAAHAGVLKALSGAKLLVALALVSTGAIVAGGAVYVGMSTKVRALEKRVHAIEATREAATSLAAIPTAPQQSPQLQAAPIAPAPAPTPTAQPRSAIPQIALAPRGAGAVHTPTTAQAPPTSPQSSDGLAEENALIERARTALLRGQLEAALGALDEHQREHPAGLLCEERDALRVQVLAQLRRGADARAAAAAFRARYAGSLLQPSVDAAIDGLR